jgi:hypothetical protein
MAVMIAAIVIMDREWSYNGRPERSRACTLIKFARATCPCALAPGVNIQSSNCVELTALVLYEIMGSSASTKSQLNTIVPYRIPQ